MPTNLLINPGFEEPWDAERSHACLIVVPEGPYIDQRGSISTPPGWLTWFRWQEGTWDQPEVREAHRDLDSLRVHGGSKAMLLFSTGRKHTAGFLQQVSVEVGQKYRFLYYGQGWSNHKDDSRPKCFPHPNDARWSEGSLVGRNQVCLLQGDIPPQNGDCLIDANWNLSFQAGIDPLGGLDPMASSVVWGEPAWIYNGYFMVPPVEAVSQADTVTVFIKTSALWPFRHNDVYLDDAELVAVEEGGVPGRGDPRLEYRRTYGLVPPGVTISEVVKAAGTVIDRHGLTIGKSADDAGIGNLDERWVIAFNPGLWGGDLGAFFEEWYPGVHMVEVNYGNDYQLAGRLLSASLLQGNGGEPFLAYPTTHPFPSPYRDYPNNITSPFGDDRGSYMHMGIDLVGSYDAWGDEALSATDGVVVEAGWHSNQGGFGYRVKVQSEAPGGRVMLIRYGHLKAGVYVRIGDRVTVGQKLGRVDNTGTSSADHLHFDVLVEGAYADPAMLMVWPEEGPEPPPPVSGMQVSIHIQKPVTGWIEFVEAVQPAGFKTVLNMETCQDVRRVSPGTLTVFRQWEAAQGEYLKMPPEEGARAWVDTFLPSLIRNAEWVDLAEPLNEMVATGDVAGIQRVVAWEIAFCEILAEKGYPARPLGLPVAVGNPQHGYETELLIPAAAAIVKHGGRIGYHGYWGSRKDGYCTLDDAFMHYSGRAFLSWDATFTAAGIRPHYLLGEGGAVLISETMIVEKRDLAMVAAAARPHVLNSLAASIRPVDWVRPAHIAPEYWKEPIRVITEAEEGYTIAWLNPNKGWRDCCNGLDHYIEQIHRFLGLVQELPGDLPERVDCLTLFTVGGGNQWSSFELSTPELQRLSDAFAA